MFYPMAEPIMGWREGDFFLGSIFIVTEQILIGVEHAILLSAD